MKKQVNKKQKTLTSGSFCFYYSECIKYSTVYTEKYALLSPM